MKLYYATGTCSLSPHIVACEASVPLDLERVDIRKSPHVTGKGDDYSAVNPSGYVPALVLDDGSVLTEGVAIVQYLADLRPGSGLAPGTSERVALQSWLNFIATELHKMLSPWLFHPEYGCKRRRSRVPGLPSGWPMWSVIWRQPAPSCSAKPSPPLTPTCSPLSDGRISPRSIFPHSRICTISRRGSGNVPRCGRLCTPKV